MTKITDQIVRKHYPKEIEAAWYTLKDFIHPLDCSVKGHQYRINKDGVATETHLGVYPLNKNFILASILSGHSIFKPSYMTKYKMYLHLSQIEVYYYRCKYNAIHSDGYGSYASQAVNLEFSGDLGIKTARKSYQGQNYILLLGIDIDAHHGEVDAQEVEAWLKKSYFAQSYWEPSSNYTGRHGYIKIAYPCKERFSDIVNTLETLFKLLDIQRNNLGFHASIDMPCGLPSQVSFVDRNPYTEDILEYVSENEMESNSELFASTVEAKYLQVNRSQAFKLPRFNQSNHTRCNMEDVVAFHNLLFYDYTYIVQLTQTLKNEDQSLFLREEDNNKELEDTTLSIVRSPQVNNSKNTTNTPKNNEFSLYDYWINKNTKTKKLNYYHEIEKLKSEQDTLKKTGSFYWIYSIYLHRVPSVEEAMDEYVAQGLNTSEEVHTPQRLARFKYCYQFISKRFDLSKCGYHLDDWDACKDQYITRITDHLQDEITLEWKKGENKVYPLKIEELALVYYGIVKSNELDKHRDAVIRYSFSYQNIQNMFQCIYGTGCHRAKCAKILHILQTIGLIKKTGNYISGVRGNCYQAIVDMLVEKEAEIEQLKAQGQSA